MTNILLYSILFIEILLAISYAINFQSKVNDTFAAYRQIIISVAFSLQGFSYIAMLLSSSDVLSYFLYAISWYSGVVLYANFITMAAYSMNYKSDFVKYAVSVIYYLGFFIYVVDTFISKGVLVYNSTGVSYPTFSTFQVILHALFYAVFIAAMAIIFSHFTIQTRKKRETYLLSLWVLTFSFTLIGVMFEFVELIFNTLNYPFALLVCIGTILCMPKLLTYHRSIILRRDDYSEYLSSDNIDIVLVCDDEFRVKFLNKRAVIAGQVIKEDFLGRRLPDIYLMTPQIENTLYNISGKDIISVPAVYSPLDRNITLEIHPFYDKFNELLSTVITVYGLENQEASTAPIEKDKVANNVAAPEIQSNDFSIAAGAHVLIVNENSIRLNVFEKMMQPYSVVVTRAINVQLAYREITDNTYDMIFIDQNISKITPYDFVRKIRALDDDYYRLVPICYCTDTPIDDQYKEFIEAGFSDYLIKPISAKHLNNVLSRWLWRRYAKEYIGNPELISPDSDTKELRLLLEDCNMYYEKKNSLLLANCLRAIRQQCVLLNLSDFEYEASKLYKAVILDDLVYFEKHYNSFQSEFIKVADSMELNMN